MCPYCKKPLETIECAKYHADEDTFSFHEAITFVLYVISLVLPSFRKRLNDHKYKTTCTNKDCIGYLDGCYVNKHYFKKTIWEYEFSKEKDQENK